MYIYIYIYICIYIGIPIGGMLILDLTSEASPVWSLYNSFFNHSWIWCALLIYGGNRGIYGPLDTLATQPYAGLCDVIVAGVVTS